MNFSHQSTSAITKSAAYLALVRELPVNEVRVANKSWTYITTGSGDEAVLFIRGIGASFDVWWQQMAAFDKNYKVISISYPGEPDERNLAKAINLILEKEQLLKVHIVANSYGGCIAQWFAARYPQQVASLILSNAYLPQAEVLRKYRAFYKIVRWVPNWLAAKLFSKINAAAMKGYEQNQEVAAYMQKTGMRNLNKQEFLAVQDALTLSSEFSTANLGAIPTLIINSADDSILEEELQSNLRERYPWAKFYTFETGGHFPYLTKPDIFNSIVLNFLNSGNL